MPDVGSLDGKVAIVTGAGRGIGRGEVLALAAEGATVVVNDVDPGTADAVVAEVTATGGKAVANRDDVASWSGAEALVRQAVDDLGRLDVLVNNAGLLRDRMSFSMTADEFDEVIRVHLKGHVAPSHFAAAHWRAQAKKPAERGSELAAVRSEQGRGDAAGGAIVNTTSEAGLYGGTGQVNYVAAKAGIAAMTVALARELKSYGVRVNAVAPRARTRMTEAVLGDFGAPPADGGFDPWDADNVGPVVAWLAGPLAPDVNGQVFVVFGGGVHLMSGWDLAGEIEQDHRWSVGELADRAAELFGDRHRGVPKMGFGR